MKNTSQSSSESLIIIGDNFISNSLYISYKRIGRIKMSIEDDIINIVKIPTYIIDCTFDKKKQDQIIKYCEINKIKKLLILNHWERKDLPKIDTIIIQAIVYDVYGNEHMSFFRPGNGNIFEDDVSYCSFISEAIRRLYEAKIYGLPIVNIPYSESKVKIIYVDNLYEPINYMMTLFNKNSVYSIYDEEKTIGYLLDPIKETIDYNGSVNIVEGKRYYTQYVKSLDFNIKRNYYDYNIRKIYNYLINNNERFMII